MSGCVVRYYACGVGLCYVVSVDVGATIGWVMRGVEVTMLFVGGLSGWYDRFVEGLRDVLVG